MLHKIVLLAIAGAIGTLSRYGLAGLVQRINSPSFPFGTMAVNIGGCFVFGLLCSIFENRWSVSGETRVVILVGFIGAFTTFSSFIFETGELFRSAEWFRASANMIAQNGLGLFALFLGTTLGRLA